MFLKIFLLTLVLIGFAVFLLSVKILFSKLILNREGRFPNTSIGGNKYLRKKGITCPRHEECKLSNGKCH